MNVHTGVRFDSGYYQSIIDRYAYEDLVVAPFEAGLGDQDADELAIRYLCQFGLEDYTAASRSRRAITTGFGMSGAPHMGTICQILAIQRLHASGESCQIVLGDLDAYNGKSRALSEVSALADRYGRFIRRLVGDPDKLVVRTQRDALSVLRTMYLLAQDVRAEDLVDVEEDNHDYYVAKGIVDKTLTLPRALSLLLMVADFAALASDRDRVLVQLGIDEHRYVRFAESIMARRAESAVEGTGSRLSALYTRMIPGLGGHPKMSKSIPGSSIDVTMDASEVRAALDRDKHLDPALSPTFQIACQIPVFSGEDVRGLAAACAGQTREWDAAKSETAAYLAEVFTKW